MDSNSIKAWVETKKDEIVAIFSDGFQLWDIFKCARIVTEAVLIADQLKTPAEQRLAANMLVEIILKETDTPWLPDQWSDPVMQKGFSAAFEWLIPDQE